MTKEPTSCNPAYMTPPSCNPAYMTLLGGKIIRSIRASSSFGKRRYRQTGTKNPTKLLVKLWPYGLRRPEPFFTLSSSLDSLRYRADGNRKESYMREDGRRLVALYTKRKLNRPPLTLLENIFSGLVSLGDRKEFYSTPTGTKIKSSSLDSSRADGDRKEFYSTPTGTEPKRVIYAGGRWSLCLLLPKHGVFLFCFGGIYLGAFTMSIQFVCSPLEALTPDM